jgi:glycosyltransferase involved in cell wall biosynthesis
MIVSPWYPVPPVGYGGIELVAFNLARELHRRGHNVTVIGQEGSHGPFEVAAVAPAEWTADLGTREHIRGRSFDIIHDHSGLNGILLTALLGHAGSVATLHGDISEAECEFLAAVDSDVRLVGISRSQQAQCPGVEWGGMVHNAIDPSEYQPVVRAEDKEDYVVQLARINPSKGQHLAIEFARRVRVPLVLAGKVDPDATEYFENEIQPHIGNGVEWRENVVGSEKARLLANAKAMIFPIQWEEPFGLAMIEAMVSGTPVLATPRGAAVEIVEPGVTGWLADDLDGLVSAYGRLGEIDLRRCVEVTTERFGLEQMGNGYLSVYEAARLGQAFRKPA